MISKGFTRQNQENLVVLPGTPTDSGGNEVNARLALAEVLMSSGSAVAEAALETAQMPEAVKIGRRCLPRLNRWPMPA